MAYNTNCNQPKRRRLLQASCNKAKRRRLKASDDHEKKATPDWSDLQTDPLELILRKLSFIDILSFRVVCRFWRSVAKTHLSSFSASNQLIQPPWLLLPIDTSDPENSDLSHGFRFLNLAEKKFHSLNHKRREYFGESSRIVGSSRGWLVCLDEKKTPFLFNPFLDVIVKPCLVDPLPFITKAILWSDPTHSGNNYGIVAIYRYFHSGIAFAKCGESHWSFLKDSSSPRMDYCNILCSKGGYLFALSDMGSLDIWDMRRDVPEKFFRIEACFPEERMEFEKSLGNLYTSKFYLVESQGELLLVIRYIGEFVCCYDGEVVHEADCVDEFVYPYMTKMFRVYKLDFEKGMWEKFDSLGDQILFLGGNQSMSLSAREFPQYEGNSIYFTDDYWERMDEHYEYGGHDNGVFNLGDGCIKEICDMQRIQPPPFWVVPSLVQR